jgi:hypothetical protein
MNDPLIHRLVDEGYNSGQRLFGLGLIFLMDRFPHPFDHGLDAGLDVAVSHAAGFVLSHPFFGRLMYSQWRPPFSSEQAVEKMISRK